ncbi:MAG TPA: glycosyltransferase [Thermoanaerobaculia bacterium]|nr:glycosyltransferase [Thermoanaerobaculia bacterium]
MKTAVVHDWLTGMRGGESVLEEILGLVPDPTVFTLFHFPGSVSARIEAFPIVTSFLQRLATPRAYRSLLPFFPAAVESFDLSGFDLVVSSSHCVAKGAIAREGARHLCYCHTPVRYAYGQFDAYFPRRSTRAYALKKLFVGRLRRWDRRTAGRPDRVLANSSAVAARVHDVWNRDAAVVFPPVDVDFFTPGTGPAEDYALCVGALVPYKKFDVAIEWARRTGRALRIVGAGPEEKRLRENCPASVSFESGLSRETLRERYRRCAFFLQPGEEDFGIASVEAQACGRPVVALGRGGALDVVTGPASGATFPEPVMEHVVHAIDSLSRVGFNAGAAVANARRFSRERFRADFSREVQNLTE